MQASMGTELLPVTINVTEQMKERGAAYRDELVADLAEFVRTRYKAVRGHMDGNPAVLGAVADLFLAQLPGLKVGDRVEIAYGDESSRMVARINPEIPAPMPSSRPRQAWSAGTHEPALTMALRDFVRSGRASDQIVEAVDDLATQIGVDRHELLDRLVLGPSLTVKNL